MNVIRYLADKGNSDYKTLYFRIGITETQPNLNYTQVSGLQDTLSKTLKPYTSGYFLNYFFGGGSFCRRRQIGIAGYCVLVFIWCGHGYGGVALSFRVPFFVVTGFRVRIRLA